MVTERLDASAFSVHACVSSRCQALQTPPFLLLHTPIVCIPSTLAGPPKCALLLRQANFFTLFPVPRSQGFLLPIPGAVIYPAHSCKLHLRKAKLPFHTLHPYLKNKNPETLFMVCGLGFLSLMFGGSEPFSQSL